MDAMILMWASILLVTLGREWLFIANAQDVLGIAVWLGLIGLAFLPFIATIVPLHNRRLAALRMLTGGMALIGIYGAILHLGAPLAAALILLDTVVLLALDRRRGSYALVAAISLFIFAAGLRRQYYGYDVFTGGLWAVVAIAGRAWGYRVWHALHKVAEGRFWTIALPLIGSMLGGLILSLDLPPLLPTAAAWLSVATVAVLGLFAYHTTDRVIARYGALDTRLAELGVLPVLGLGHAAVSGDSLDPLSWLLSVAVALAAGRAFMQAPERLKQQL